MARQSLGSRVGWVEGLLDRPALQLTLGLIARLLLVHLFLVSGAMKFLGWEQTQSFFESLGLPWWLVPIAGGWELVFALMFTLGLRARVAALALAAFAGAATLIGHSDWARPGEAINFMKNFALVGGLLLYAVLGPDRATLDRRRGLAQAGGD